VNIVWIYQHISLNPAQNCSPGRRLYFTQKLRSPSLILKLRKEPISYIEAQVGDYLTLELMWSLLLLNFAGSRSISLNVVENLYISLTLRSLAIS